jgi:hypothetical protein
MLHRSGIRIETLEVRVCLLVYIGRTLFCNDITVTINNRSWLGCPHRINRSRLPGLFNNHLSTFSPRTTAFARKESMCLACQLQFIRGRSRYSSACLRASKPNQQRKDLEMPSPLEISFLSLLHSELLYVLVQLTHELRDKKWSLLLRLIDSSHISRCGTTHQYLPTVW